MAAVVGAHLHERRVAVETPLVAGVQAKLYWRRIGARGADGSVRVGNGRATRDRGRGSAVHDATLRDRLPEVAAGDVVSGIVVDQQGRIRLLAVVPGCRTSQRQSVDHTGLHRGLETPD